MRVIIALAILLVVGGLVDAEILCDKTGCVSSTTANSKSIGINMGESKVSFTPALSSLSTPTTDTSKTGAYKMTATDYSVNIYPRAEKEGFEFDIVLEKPPIVNVFSYAIDDSGDLAYEYQPPLTEEEIRHGAERPDDIVGSYAIFDHNGLGGQIAIIYRPLVYDKAGNKIWGVLTIDKGTMLIEVDKDWLAKAEYPVTIDPVLGYTSVGGSTDYWNARINGGCYTATEDGTAFNITYYISTLTSGHCFNMTVALYNKTGTTYYLMSTATTYKLVGNDNGGANCVSTHENGYQKWLSWELANNVSIYNASVYCIAVVDNQTSSGVYHRWAYTSSGVSFYKSNTFPSFPNPLTSVTAGTQKKSGYIGYYSPTTTLPPSPGGNCTPTNGAAWVINMTMNCHLTSGTFDVGACSMIESGTLTLENVTIRSENFPTIYATNRIYWGSGVRWYWS